jgi:hypothetical protein
MAKYNIKELMRALEYFQKEQHLIDIKISLDDRDRLLLESLVGADSTTVRLYRTDDAGNQLLMPEIIESRRF